MIVVIGNDELPYSETVYRFEGYRNGDTNVSFVLLDAPGTMNR